MAIGDSKKWMQQIYSGTTGSTPLPLNTTTTSGFVATTTTAVDEINKPIVTRCAKEGHEMHRECELEDGTLAGVCMHCGELIKGRRLPGGLAVAKLRSAIEDALCSDKEIIAEEFLRLADEVEAEENALSEARSLLRLAERALIARSV